MEAPPPNDRSDPNDGTLVVLPPPVQETYSDQSDETQESFQSDSKDSRTIRLALGAGTARFSDFINENVIAARYGAMASIGMLGAYAIAQTPLFFRYKTVSEIPSAFFRRRKHISGRLMVCNNNSNHSTASTDIYEPITCYLRHLTPIERLLPQSCLDRLLKLYPGVPLFSNSIHEDISKEMIWIQIAGIQYQSNLKNNSKSESSSTSVRQLITISYDSNQEILGKEWIKQLSKERSLVKCQLLGRRVAKSGCSSNQINRGKRPIPGLSDASSSEMNKSIKYTGQEVAVGKLSYRPQFMQLFLTDFGESMVRKGYAVVSDDGLYPHTPKERVVDTTDETKVLQHDAAYMERLGRAEYYAAKGSYGIWADPDFRESRGDVVDEIEFQEQASVFRKVWRWWRG